MSFSAAKRYQSKIGSHLKGEEDIYSLNKHALGPGELAESEWLKAGLASPDMTPKLGSIDTKEFEKTR